MGWEIHITRAKNWTDSDRAPITADEWLAMVEADPELMIDPRDNGPCFALWLAHRVSDDHPWFDWSDDTIEVAVLDLWYRNRDALRKQGQEYDPVAFSRDFADNYFADDSKVDIWPDGALETAKRRVSDYQAAELK